MEEEKEPYFDLTKSSKIGKYVAYYIDEFRKNPEKKEEVREKLRVVLSPSFEHYLKVVDGKHFTPTFYQKIGRKRKDSFKSFACEIDKKYEEFEF